MAYLIYTLFIIGWWSTGVTSGAIDVKRQQATAAASTCGYKSGVAEEPRTANPGFICTTNTPLSLWGFCTTAASNIEGCNLAGYCVDSGTCSTGCGPFPGRTDVQTYTCDADRFCSTVLLTASIFQTYTYIACGEAAVTEHYLATPLTTDAASSSTTEASSQTLSPAQTSLPSTVSATSTAAAATTTAAASSGSSGVNAGAIAGGVVGGLAVVCATILGIFYIRHRRQHGEAVTVANSNSSGNIDAMKMQTTETVSTGNVNYAPSPPVEMYTPAQGQPARYQ